MTLTEAFLVALNVAATYGGYRIGHADGRLDELERAAMNRLDRANDELFKAWDRENEKRHDAEEELRSLSTCRTCGVVKPCRAHAVCQCGGVMFGDGYAHTALCPAREQGQ